MTTSTWQLQTAKQRFSEVVRAVEAGEPQFITKHGKPVAVIIDIDDYRKTHSERLSFSEYLVAASSIVGLEHDLVLPPRTIDPDRTIHLFDDEP
jgi:prevent-host-death family protein